MLEKLDKSKYWTVKECSDLAGVSLSTIRNWMDAGHFTWIKLSLSERLAEKESFSAFIESLRNPILHSTT